jgi:hypothetical protein
MRILTVCGVACLSVFYFGTFWPTQLNPSFIVYGQTTSGVFCTTCPFMNMITPSSVTAGASQPLTIRGMNLNQGSLTAIISGSNVGAATSGLLPTALQPTHEQLALFSVGAVIA